MFYLKIEHSIREHSTNQTFTFIGTTQKQNSDFDVWFLSHLNSALSISCYFLRFFIFNLPTIYLQIYRNIQIFLRCHKIFQTNASIQGPITNGWKLPRCVWAFNSDHQSGKSSLSHFYKSPVQLKFHEF